MVPLSTDLLASEQPLPSLAKISEFLSEWESVQSTYADLPGKAGAAQRAEAYTPFFLRFGNEVFIAPGCRFYHPQRIVLEDDVRVNEGALIYGSGGVHIGRHARIGPRVFIHSANHEIDPGPYAFHERGYIYRRVDVGDNCLISANVSILPGALLGANTFLACGAVVPAGRYPENGHLMGVPGRDRRPDVQPEPYGHAPTVLVIGKPNHPRTAAMRRIVSTLGMPQVIVAASDEAPRWQESRSIRAVVELDPALSHPLSEAATWRLSKDVPNVPSVDLDRYTLELHDGRRFEFASSRTRVVVPAPSNRPAIQDAALITLANALKRMQKRAHDDRDKVDLTLAAGMLALGAQRADRVDIYERLLVLIELGHDSASPSGPDPELSASMRATHNLLNDPSAAAEYIFSHMHAGEAIRRRAKDGRNFDFNLRTLQTCPELLPALAMLPSRNDAAASLARMQTILAHADKSWTVACVACAAYLIGDISTFHQAADRLMHEDLFDPDIRLVRRIPQPEAGWSYQSLVGVVLAIRAQELDPGFHIQMEKRIVDRWSFSAVGPLDETSPVWLSGIGPLISPHTRTISSSLVDNWMQAIAPPLIEEGQFELTEESYEPIVPALQAAWRAVFREILSAADQPVIEVLPWPDGCEIAVSLRYDVDRAVTSGQIMHIIDFQRRCFDSPCAAWYDIPGVNHAAKLRTVLEQHGQEIGVHGLAPNHAEVRERGVTMHSGPGSAYWRGRRTLDTFAETGALYGELLSTQIDRPQPVFASEGLLAQAGNELWVTPLHFPLEGSTNDEDLSYFDRLYHHFRAALERGAHVIIASHPDLNQDILEHLVRRESWPKFWGATVQDVIDRCQRLFSEGALTLVTFGEDETPHLLTKHAVSDVTVKIEYPDGRIERHTLQCVGGWPRPLPCKSDG